MKNQKKEPSEKELDQDIKRIEDMLQDISILLAKGIGVLLRLKTKRRELYGKFRQRIRKPKSVFHITKSIIRKQLK